MADQCKDCTIHSGMEKEVKAIFCIIEERNKLFDAQLATFKIELQYLREAKQETRADLERRLLDMNHVFSNLKDWKDENRRLIEELRSMMLTRNEADLRFKADEAAILEIKEAVNIKKGRSQEAQLMVTAMISIAVSILVMGIGHYLWK